MNKQTYLNLCQQAKQLSNNYNYCNTYAGFKDYLTIKQDLIWMNSF